VDGVGQFEQHAVRSGGQAAHDDRLSVGIYKMPWGVVNGDVDVADPRRHVKGTVARRPLAMTESSDRGGWGTQRGLSALTGVSR
jgi:hypothetical protein